VKIESKHTGDNLEQARRFVDAAEDGMALLLSDTRLDPVEALQALNVLQKQARALQCRAIDIAAQSIRECYDKSRPQAQIDGRIIALNKLLTQYGAGLDEIFPKPANQAPEDLLDDKVSGHSEQRAPSERGGTDDPIIIDPAARSRFDQARKTLQSLLPRAGNDAPALARLSAARWMGDFDLGMAEPSPAENISRMPSSVAFESLMPDISYEALRRARMQQKSISLSYAITDFDIPSDQLLPLQNRLIALIDVIVENESTSPSIGLARAQTIDVNAERMSNGKHCVSLGFAGVLSDQSKIPTSCRVDTRRTEKGTDYTEIAFNLAELGTLSPAPASSEILDSVLADDLILPLEMGA